MKKATRKQKQKRQGILRLAVQCVSFAFQNGYIKGWMTGSIYSGDNKQFCVPGLNCYSCPGAIGACPIGSLQAVLDSGMGKFPLYVLGFIGLVGMFCGRFVCGWICPFGLIQDLVYKIPFFKKKKNLPGHGKLRYLRYAVLMIFVIILPMAVLNAGGIGQPWFCEFICPSGTLLGGIPLIAANESLRAQIGPRFAWKVILLVLFLGGALVYYRPFCKYICPLGALYGLMNPVSVYRLKVDGETCVTCKSCRKACGMDIKVWETPNSTDCIRCGKCKAACPTGAITSTFSGKAAIDPKLTAAESAAAAPETPAEIMEEAAPAAEETAVRDGAAPAGDVPEQAEKPRRTGKDVLLAVLGAFAVLSMVGTFLGLHIDLLTKIVSYGLTDSLATYGRYIFCLLISAVPMAMLTVLGVQLIAALFRPGRLEGLRAWPKRLLILTVCSLVFCYLVYLGLLPFLGAGFAVSNLAYTWMFMLEGAIVMAAVAVYAIILHLLLREKKPKAENR